MIILERLRVVDKALEVSRLCCLHSTWLPHIVVAFVGLLWLLFAQHKLVVLGRTSHRFVNNELVLAHRLHLLLLVDRRWLRLLVRLSSIRFTGLLTLPIWSDYELSKRVIVLDKLNFNG